jgi:hypothetical protein
MKLSKDSTKLITYFEHDTLPLLKPTVSAKKLIIQLYNDIISGVKHINKMKMKQGKHFCKLSMERITDVKQVPIPSTFSLTAFPENIISHIQQPSLTALTYHFNLFNRTIQIIFIIEQDNSVKTIQLYNEYINYMLVWLYIVDRHSSNKCAKQLKIFLYHTNLLKQLPKLTNAVLNENNVNTAFTKTCPHNSEIVVFRKEEWFKVFIHETFHNFALDFSDMNLDTCNKTILALFPVKSNVNLFEAYTEFWARIMNALFCSFIQLKDKHNIVTFVSYAEHFINLERTYSFFQMVKVLKFMGLTYADLYKKDNAMRHALYKEDTNVLSYFILTSILMNNCYDFMLWCNTHNNTVLNFHKTVHKLTEFCNYIKSKYKTNAMLKNVYSAEKQLNSVKQKSYVAINLRMTMLDIE